MDDESDWLKQLLVGMAVLVIVALLVGGIVGLIAVKAANVAGIGTTPAPDTSFAFPTPSRTQPTTQTSPTRQTTPVPTTGSTPRRHPRQRSGITLTVSPIQAGVYERVNLTGTYQAPSGTSLQVQRREGASWVDFPTSASVNGGTFATYIQTGHPGQNRFRVVDSATGKASNIVTVQIG
jgi:hypothetical protein